MICIRRCIFYALFLVVLVAQAAELPTPLINLATGKCLDVAGNSLIDGGAVNQFGCHGGANQQWWVEPEASAPGFFSIRNQHSGRCVDDPAGGATPGRMQQFGCHHGPNQLFRLEPVADHFRGMRMVSQRSGRCLALAGGATGDGTAVVEQSCDSGLSQRWQHLAPVMARREAVMAGTIAKLPFALEAGESYTFVLDGFAANTSPCLHIRRVNGGGARTVCRNATGSTVVLSYALPSLPRRQIAGVELYVFARPGSPPGSATLTVDDHTSRPRSMRVPRFAGTAVAVPGSPIALAYQYQTAQVAGGAADTLLLALDAAGAVVAVDDNGGVGGASRIAGAGSVTRLVVGVPGGAREGLTRVYANDVGQDADGDGLGRDLERALGSCDNRVDHPRCAFVTNLRDSDGDGIEDGAEVFGVAAATPLLLPAWGASPVHKDVFVEADWTNEFQQTPLNQERIRRMQYHLAHGPAAHLDNPDGVDGIALHVDAGIEPSDPADRTLYGVWGGASRVDSWTDHGPPAGSFDAARLPYFRQLLLVKGGGSNGFGRYWYASGEDPDTIMHEFGHSLGLQHEHVVSGPTQPVIEGLNCSPAYPSIMSYATPHATFLTGDGFPAEGINPSSLCEADGLGSEIGDLSFITQSLGGIPVDNARRAIDWNRDLAYSGTATSGASRCTPAERVRAVVNWGYSGCDAHTQGGFALSPQIAPAGRRDGGDVLGGPAIARVGARLYVFYVKRDAQGTRRLFYQSAAIGPKASAGCTDGFKVYSNGRSDPCMRFSGPFEIALFETAMSGGMPVPGAPIAPTRVAAFSDTGAAQLAIVDASAQIRTFRIPVGDLEAGRDPRNVLADPAVRGVSGAAATAGSDLSFIVIGLDRAKYGGSGRHLALYYVDPAGAVRWASKEWGAAGAFVDRGAVVDANGVALATAAGDAPAVASWSALGSLDDLELYMVLQRSDARFSLYAFDRTRDRWSDLTQNTFGQAAVVGPGHNQKIAFWFQPLLDGRGEIIERGKGYFSILFRYGEDVPPHVAAPSTPSMWRMANVSRLNPPSRGLSTATFQKFGHEWYSVRGNNYPIGLGGGYVVYSDETMPGAKAALVKLNDQQGHDLFFLPFADGIFDMTFKPSPDFKVMEGTLCRSLRGEAFCGNSQQSKWGY